MQGRFPRRRPIVTRVPRAGSATEAVRRVPRPLVLAEPGPRHHPGRALLVRPPLVAPPPAPAVRPLCPQVVAWLRPLRGATILFTGRGAQRQRLPMPPSPVPGVPTRRFVRPARADVNFSLAARRDTTFARSARQDVAFTRSASGTMSISSNLSWFRGEDVTVDFSLTPAVDVTGWTISFTLMDTLGGNVQTGFPVVATIVDGPRGKFRVAVPSSATSSIPPGRYVWDCRRTDSGSRTTLADGYLDLRQEVTP